MFWPSFASVFGGNMNHGSSVTDNISSWFSGTNSLQHNYIFREEDFFPSSVNIFHLLLY